MKKLIFLMGFFYAFSFFSCGEKNEKSESFAEIIKDSTQRMELLRIADSINMANAHPKLIDKDDQIDDKGLDEFRDIRDSHFKVEGNVCPIVIVSMLDMLAIINPPANHASLDVKDSLVFYLGIYKNKHDWVARYNKRNVRNPRDNYQFDKLEYRPTFLIEAIKTEPSTKAKMYFDVARLCPPPPGNCRVVP